MKESNEADKLKGNIDKNELIDIFKEVSKKLSENPNRCGTLVYTKKESNKPIIREPEASYVLSLVLSGKNINFGLEVPTKKKYKFKINGKNPKSASIDLAIEPNEKQINVELKEGQRETIKKDFEKFLREDVEGCAFFHILKNSDSGTLPSLFKKYNKAYANLVHVKDKKSKWFLLFIFIKEKKECLWKAFDDITAISLEEFDQNKFLQEST